MRNRPHKKGPGVERELKKQLIIFRAELQESVKKMLRRKKREFLAVIAHFPFSHCFVVILEADHLFATILIFGYFT